MKFPLLAPEVAAGMLSKTTIGAADAVSFLDYNILLNIKSKYIVV
jgi:hypothetical protein